MAKRLLLLIKSEIQGMEFKLSQAVIFQRREWDFNKVDHGKYPLENF